MKKIASIAFVALLVFACGGGNKSKLVVGKWKIADMKAPMPPNMPDSLKERFNAAVQSQLEIMKQSSVFNYKEDGTYEYNVGDKAGNGTWKINDAGTELTLTEAGNSDINKVIELTENKLVIEAPQPNGAGNLTLSLAK